MATNAVLAKASDLRPGQVVMAADHFPGVPWATVESVSTVHDAAGYLDVSLTGPGGAAGRMRVKADSWVSVRPAEPAS